MKDAEQLELSHIASYNEKTLKNSLAISYKIKHLPYHPVISLLGVYPKGIQICVHTKTFTQTFIKTSLFKAPKSALMGERTNTFWYTHSREYYVVVKR